MKSTAVEDARLVERFREGDESAFRALHARYSPIVYRRVARLVGARSEVDDVVQDVFLQVHRSLARFDTSRPFRNWIFRVTRNVTVDYQRRRPAPIDPAGLRRFGQSDAAWRQISARDKLRILDAALNQLSFEAQEAFVLHTLEGMTLAEISDLTDTSINTIAARIRRSRERLAAQLERAHQSRAALRGEGA